MQTLTMKMAENKIDLKVWGKIEHILHTVNNLVMRIQVVQLYKQDRIYNLQVYWEQYPQ